MLNAENMDKKLLTMLKLIELKFIKYIFWKGI